MNGFLNNLLSHCLNSINVMKIFPVSTTGTSSSVLTVALLITISFVRGSSECLLFTASIAQISQSQLLPFASFTHYGTVGKPTECIWPVSQVRSCEWSKHMYEKVSTFSECIFNEWASE